MKRWTFAVTVSLLLLAGCGGPEETAPPSESSPTTLSEVSTVEELKDAAVEAGFLCPKWEHSDHVALASQSGTCSSTDVLMVFSSTDDRDLVADVHKSESNNYFLVGPNWMISGPGAIELAPKLGGTAVTH